MPPLLDKIADASMLQGLSVRELKQLAVEMRQALCQLVSDRSAHFASNNL